MQRYDVIIRIINTRKDGNSKRNAFMVTPWTLMQCTDFFPSNRFFFFFFQEKSAVQSFIFSGDLSLVPRLTVGTRVGTADLSPVIPSTRLCPVHVRAVLFLRQSSKKWMTMMVLSMPSNNFIIKVCQLSSDMLLES